MNDIVIKGQAGNLAYQVTASPSEQVREALVKAGLLRVLQANPTNAWEKQIAFPGDAKRPEGFKRSSIPYNKENAELLFKKLSDAKIKIEVTEGDETVDKEFDLGLLDVVVSEYTGPEGAVPKFRDQKKFVETYLSLNEGKLSSGEPRTIVSFCASRGLTVPSEPWNEDTEFLAEVREWKEAEEKKMLLAQD